MNIAYRGGYKYLLQDSCRVQLQFGPEWLLVTDYLAFEPEGILTIAKGYAWDGPSGPAVDTPSFMRASLVHDALYQLIRDGQLGMSYRDEADRALYDLCIEDGMFRPRAWLAHQAVRMFGKPAADPKHRRPVLYAPGGGDGATVVPNQEAG
jgi:hypothetical protein